MNKITHTLTVSAIAVLMLAGCSAAPEVVNSSTSNRTAPDQSNAATQTQEVTPEVVSAPPTKTGDVCDPQNANDFICAAFYPEQAVVNVTSAPRADEPLASMSVEAKQDLAQQACSIMASGGNKDTETLVATNSDRGEGFEQWNNNLIFTAGQLAYCNEFIDAPNGIWLINEYRDMGETAAKESHKNGVTLKP